MRFDAMLCEVNPLIVTPDGEVKALDSKFTVDDNALYRHPDIAEMRDDDAADPLEALAREKHVTYVKLDGEVGVLGNGAGLTMSTVDVVTFAGGRPANFCDLGGGGDAQGVVDALSVITRDPQVKAIFFNIFGGITRCDEVARGILQALERDGARAADRRPARRHERRGGPADPRRGGARRTSTSTRRCSRRPGAPWSSRHDERRLERARRRPTSSRTPTARAPTSTCSSSGRRARAPRSTSRPAAGTSRGGCARRASRSSPAIPRRACGRTWSAAPSRCRSRTASFDVVACRTAAHHFDDVALAVGEMARVAATACCSSTRPFMGDDVEEAEKLRDPSHVRNYTEAEWRAFVEGAGLAVDDVRRFEHSIDFGAWLDRTGCEGEEAERAERAARRARRRRPADARQDRDPREEAA